MRNTLKPFLAYLPLLGTLFLGGCDKVKDTLGLSREAPDEFEVFSNPPLELPPDFTLTPPQPGMPRPQSKATQVLGNTQPKNSAAKPSQAETFFLKEVKAEERNEDIRDLLMEEQAVTPSPPQASFMSTLVQQTSQEDESIDPTQELRIKEGVS